MNPRGLVLDTTVVLMFHPIFMTKVDRSFHVQCRYQELNTQVTNSIDVSTEAATELPEVSESNDPGSTPICQYEVLKGSETGPTISFATVGDTVYHKWSCSGQDLSRYCMTVHTCVADDGQGMGQQLIDKDGCTMDSFILKQLEYNQKLEAGQYSNVFKFADKPTIFFSCMIRVDLKENLTEACPTPQEYCSPTVNMTLPVKTERRFGPDIPETFPRPTEEPRLSEDQYQYNFVDTMAQDAQQVSVLASRLIRRDTNKMLADYDVSAPTVAVIDLPETVPTPPQTIKMPKKNEVCLSKTIIVLSILLVITLLSGSTLLMVLVHRKMLWKGKRLTPFPHPDY